MRTHRRQGGSAPPVEASVRCQFIPETSPPLGRTVSRIDALETGLASFTADKTIWEYAKENDFVLVTADSDFLDLATKLGAPPKIVRLENRNYPTAQAETLLRRYAIAIADLGHSERGVLILKRDN